MVIHPLPRLRGLALNVENGALPDWVQLTPPGPAIAGRDGRGWNLSDPAAVAAAFDPAKEPQIDLEHSSQIAAPLGMPAPAVGWIKQIDVRDNALWGRVEWTAEGKATVKDMKLSGFQISSRIFEPTPGVQRTRIGDDRFGHVAPLAMSMGQWAAQHPDTLVNEAITAGKNTVSYDGQVFVFDTDQPVFPNADGSGIATTWSNFATGAGARWYPIDDSQILIFQERTKPERKIGFDPFPPDAAFDSNLHPKTIRVVQGTGFMHAKCTPGPGSAATLLTCRARDNRLRMPLLKLATDGPGLNALTSTGSWTLRIRPLTSLNPERSRKTLPPGGPSPGTGSVTRRHRSKPGEDSVAGPVLPVTPAGVPCPSPLSWAWALALAWDQATRSCVSATPWHGRS